MGNFEIERKFFVLIFMFSLALIHCFRDFCTMDVYTYGHQTKLNTLHELITSRLTIKGGGEVV